MMALKPQFDTSLPYITEKYSGVGGELKLDPNHFQVNEIPAYKPLGYGDHIYINLTKQLMTTRETQIKIAKLLNIRPEDVGHAGLKDKYAVSTQTFSILNRNNFDVKEVLETISSELSVSINWWSLHPKKLRSGHLNGNSFKVLITNMDVDGEEAFNRASQINNMIKNCGVPNFYGIQRIGKKANNVIKGFEIISGKYYEQNRWLRRYLISSFLSYTSNKYLTERISRGLFTQLIKGDIAKKHETSGTFWVEDVDTEQKRFEAKEISFTSPIFGYKMMETKSDAKIFEDEIFSSSGITINELREQSIIGTRRMGRILPQIVFNTVSEGLLFKFDLPAGSYATIILREFMKSEDYIGIPDEETEISDVEAY